VSEKIPADLKEAYDIILEYVSPNSTVDMGNLYFAANEFRSYYELSKHALAKANADLRIAIEALEKIVDDTHSMTLRKPIHNVAVNALKALSEVQK
jgi:hypothetical protein